MKDCRYPVRKNAMTQPDLPALPTKPHYVILDGLRGVAAIMVVIFHIFEASATDLKFHTDQIVNHGYLGVDFFFILSGFVIGYAYDDRWGKMSLWEFCKRRLTRLQPMVIMGMVLGAVFFYPQASELFPSIAGTPLWLMLAVMAAGSLLLPVPLSLDIRGWQEMYPLNGPGWTLFFEYLANILYATLIRRLSNIWLAFLVFLAGCALIHQCYMMGNNIGGWSLTIEQLQVGLTRLVFPFFGGLLLFRICKPSRIKHAFWWCSLIIIGVMCMPHVGGEEHYHLNGLYDAFCIIAVFPFVVYLGASGVLSGTCSKRFCKFLGELSYPLYITHYPLIYLYTAWVADNKIPIAEAIPFGALVLASSIILAVLCLKLYDEPVRNWLKKHWNSVRPGAM